MIGNEVPEQRGMFSRIKIPLIWFVVLAVALGLIVALMVAATFPDINVARVSFPNTYSSGEKIEGLLLTPKKAYDAPLPAVVFSHGILADKEIYLSFYRELARRGFAVLAIDLPGHGGSAGHDDSGGSEYKSVLAAYDWLVEDNPRVDPSRVAAVGHSLGGVASTEAGLYQPQKKFSAVIAIWCWQSQESSLDNIMGSPPRLAWKMWPFIVLSRQYDIRDPVALAQRDIISRVGPARPPNYQVIVGSIDELISVQQEKELVARAAGLEDVKQGETYGSFTDGTARRLAVTHDDHVMEIFSTEVFSATYDWLVKSFNIRPHGSAALPIIRFSLWAWIFGLCLILGLLLLVMLVILLSKKLASSPFLILPGPLYAPQRQGQMAMLSSLFFLLASALTLPMASLLGAKVPVPFLGGDVVSSVAAGQGTLLLIGVTAGAIFYYGAWNDRALIPYGEKARVILWSLLPAFAGFGLFLLLYGPLARALYLGPSLPFAWPPFIAYIVLATALLWLQGRYFHLFLLPAFGEDPKGRMKVGYVFSEGALRSAGFSLMFLPLIITQPFLIIGRPGFIRMPLLAGAFLIALPGFLLLAWINLYFHRKKASLLLPSLAIVLIQAYFLTTLISTH